MSTPAAEKKARLPETASSSDCVTPPPRQITRTVLPNSTVFASPDTSRALIQEDKVDAYIANALYDMSLQERESAYQELHGVKDEIVETPQLLADKLLEFEVKLTSKIQSLSNDSALRLAMESSPDYVQNQKFQLKFLRADQFDVDKAVSRLVSFFEMKKYLFGREKLAKTITLNDLDKHDKASLESGFFQVLPVRDAASRAVLVIMHKHRKFNVVDNMTRVLYYIAMSSLEDEETQRKGFTIIIYGVGKLEPPRPADFQFISHGAWCDSALPIRISALHHCFDDPKFRRFINFCLPLMPQTTRARAKVHLGSGLECFYAMMTYGIPTQVLPVNTVDWEGLKRKNHIHWLKMRKQQESNILNPQGLAHIVVPTNRDILFGRGKKYREHTGNLKMVNTLEAYIELYESVGVKEKSTVIANVTRKLVDDGARFLKLEGDVWQPVEEKLAREKVSHCFRTRIRINGNTSPPHEEQDLKSSTNTHSNSVDSKRPRTVVE